MAEIHEIKIGRQVNGPLDVVVPETFSSVSRVHAKIVKIGTEYFLEDLESKNGTYILGKNNPVSRTKVTKGQTILLGSDNPGNAYKIVVDEVIAVFTKIEEDSRTDWSIEFNDLKKIYCEYIDEVNKIKKDLQRKSQLPRITISVVIGVILLLIITLVDIPPEIQKFQYPVMIIVMAVAGALPFLSKPPDAREKITEIEIKYSSKYICPKCKKPLNLNIHWKKLEAVKKCPHGCGAEYAK